MSYERNLNSSECYLHLPSVLSYVIGDIAMKELMGDVLTYSYLLL